MGKCRVYIASFVLLTVLAATSGQSESGATGDSSSSQTATRMQTARRAGSAPVTTMPSGQVKGPSKLDLLLEKLTKTKLSRRKDPKVKPAATAQPVAPSTGGKSPTTRPAHTTVAQPVRATTDDAAAAAEKAAEEGLARLKAIPVGAIANPRALADALYMAGKMRGATLFYERALAGVTPDPKAGKKPPLTPAEQTDKAWVLYQLGNIHVASNPDLAAGYYRRLMDKHGDSDWYGPAKAQADLIRWKQDNDPVTLIKGIAADTETQ